METTHTESDISGMREFYLPATFKFTKGPSRIEKTIKSIFRKRGGDTKFVSGPSREFYLPGTSRAAPRKR